jgi:hypothetical protein
VVAAGIHTISELRDRDAASARSSSHDQLCARPTHFPRTPHAILFVAQPSALPISDGLRFRQNG